MLLYRFTPKEIARAIKTCNEGYYKGQMRFETTRTAKTKRTQEYRITGVLRLNSKDAPGMRLTWRGHRTRKVDWEGHYDFMAALFAQRPDGRITTGYYGACDYRGEVDFYFKCQLVKGRNIGSKAEPVTFGSRSVRG